MKNTVHDSEILSYHADFENSQLIMFVKDEENRKYKVIFEGLLTFCFEHQMSNSIILDIVKGEVSSFISEKSILLSEGKNYFWPLDYESEDELLNYLNEKKLNYYELQASYG
ncbi:hypothetical protein G4010_002283, partial [Listeria monocytogenes]|nr:hypothetical protein [Listeria monocytogenes]EAG1183990.1 hypothetical protein [Listeria monocytogenes]EAG4977261.1 hypothetical protein [Listeria monocytogenes]EAG4998174.1 hypothetical protein [Listeria monocytogenes]EAH1563507.1 hypothetical protein [Listeria monocytogenes]